jgi:hypothetical protein
MSLNLCGMYSGNDLNNNIFQNQLVRTTSNWLLSSLISFINIFLPFKSSSN